MAKKNKIIARVQKLFKSVSKKREAEYSKRLLNRIINSSILMMWATYVLAWCGKTEVAETLSKTIATSIIAVVVGYLAKSVIENISKHTDTFGKNNNITYENFTDTPDDEINMNRDC